MNISWDQVHEEALGLLRNYIRIDTTNPPGAERAAADFLSRTLEAEGLSVEEYADDPMRPNIICRLKGDGSRRPFILLHHMDVVMAEHDKWTVDPFEGVVKDGCLWGRGALDMKGLGIMELMAFLLAHRLSVPVKRDLVFLAVSDEETGGSRGAGWLTAQPGVDLDAEYVLNEGGAGWRMGDMSGFNLAIGEKGPLWLRISAEGAPGHGSVPIRNSAPVRLVRALARITDHEFPIRIIDEMRVFLEKVGIDPSIEANELARHDLLTIPHFGAMFRDTVSLTVMNAGRKENVIPSTAEAILDCRLIPGRSAGVFMDELRAIIDDDGISLEVCATYDSSISSADSPIYHLMEDILARYYPGVPVLPTISTGFTDSRWFRSRGIASYGLLPFVSDVEVLRTIHGHDERLALESLKKGSMVVFDLVKGLNE